LNAKQTPRTPTLLRPHDLRYVKAAAVIFDG
jgi:hypothetical protein